VTEIKTFLEDVIQLVEFSKFPLREKSVLSGTECPWVSMVLLNWLDLDDRVCYLEITKEVFNYQVHEDERS